MELYILNNQFQTIKFIDDYSSLEWVTRYYDTGEFVIRTRACKENVETLKSGYYLVREDDERIMMIEKIEINTSNATGNEIAVSGRSIEAILGRRIIWTQTNSKAGETVEAFTRRLVNENCINPTITNRKIPNLKLGTLKGFTEKIDIQVTGNNLLTTIIEICKTYNIGFKITMNEASELVFNLYKGIDRSYNQNSNPYVIFSENFDNIIKTEYMYDETNLSNVALIGGEGEGTERRYQMLGIAVGINRREIFVDAKDISSNSGEIAIADYNNLLIERGNEKIAENSFTESYEGEVDTTNLYQYKKDFDIGDIVEIEDKYRESEPRIVGMIESKNANGYRVVPTFGVWEV